MIKKYFKMLLGLLVVVSLAGCNIKMSASERVGNANNEFTSVEVVNPKDGKFSVLTVEYKPYDLAEVADVLLGMSREDVISTQSSSEFLLIDELKDGLQIYQAASIGIMDAGSMLDVKLKTDAGQYERVFSYISDGEYSTYSNSNFAKYFSKEEIGNISLKQAEEQVQTLLEKLGLEISYSSSCVMNVDLLNRTGLNAPGFERDKYGSAVEDATKDWKSEDQVYYFCFRTMYQETVVEDLLNESLVCVAYSPITQQVISIHTSMPILTDQIYEEKEIQVIPGEDAVILADDILKTNSNTKKAQICEAELVYTRQFGTISFENHTVRLDPAWKISYESMINGQKVIDYILLNAENGQQFTSAVPLF